MYIFAILFAFGLCSGLFMLLWANFQAVEGYEDDEGFHTGRSSAELAELEHPAH